MKGIRWMPMLVLALAVPSWALDNNAFAVHLRKALNLDTRADIKVLGAPAPAGFGDLMKVSVSVGGNPYDVYMTKDEKTYFWGMMVNRTVDPDLERAKKLNLSKVHSEGSPTALVTVVEFSDMECQFCQKAHKAIKENLFKVYKPSEVRLVFKHYPLQMHPWAENAAIAVECAGRQKETAFWSMLNQFFDDQEKIKKEDVKGRSIEYAKKMGLDTKMFEGCLDDSTVTEKIQADKREGVAVGVASTPTFIINGRGMRGFRDFEDMKVIIDEKLAEVKKK